MTKAYIFIEENLENSTKYKKKKIKILHNITCQQPLLAFWCISFKLSTPTHLLGNLQDYDCTLCMVSYLLFSSFVCLYDKVHMSLKILHEI